jgi:ribosomal protein S18 acetylase RimI-like enzyme
VAAPGIRPSRPEDRAALLALIVELQEHERRLHDGLRPGHEIAEAYLAYLEHHLRVGEGELLVAERDGEVVGFIAHLVERYDGPEETPDSGVFALVSDLCVSERRRGQGIARALLAAAEAYARGKGLARLRVEVLSANREAAAAYRRFGFEPYTALLENRL